MKKLIHLTVFCFIAKLSISQSFYKNALVIHAGAGIDIYNTTYSYKTKNTTVSATAKETDRAANSNFVLGAEYGLHKYFGLGLNFKNNNYFTSTDSVTKATPTAKSFDISLAANFHAVSVKRFDLLIGSEFGYSNLVYKTNDAANLVLKGKGTYTSIYVNPRIYFGRFGINLKFYAPFVNYSKMVSNNEDVNYYIISKWKGSPGFGMSFGLQYRFLDSK